MTLGEQVIIEARKLVDVPYRHQGRTLRGLDCVGLCVYVAGQLGVAVQDQRGYGQVPDGETLLQAVESQPFLQRIHHYEPGAVLLMRMTDSPQHGAIYCGDTIIHAYSGVKKVVEHRYADVWRARVLAMYGWRA